MLWIYASSAVRKTRSIRTLVEIFLLSIIITSGHSLNSVDINLKDAYRQTSLSSRPRPSQADSRTFSENYSQRRINLQMYFGENSALVDSPETSIRAPNGGKAEPVELDFSGLREYIKPDQPDMKLKKEPIKDKIRKGVIPRSLEAFKKFYNWIIQSFKGLQRKTKSPITPKATTQSQGRPDGLNNLLAEFGPHYAQDSKTQRNAAVGGQDTMDPTDSSAAAYQAKSGDGKVAEVKDRDVDKQTFSSAKALREHYESKITQAISADLQNYHAIFKFIDVGFEIMRRNFPPHKAAKIAAPGMVNACHRGTQEKIEKKLKEIITDILQRLRMDASQFQKEFQGYNDWYEIMYDVARHPGFSQEVYWPMVNSAYSLVDSANALYWGLNNTNKVLKNVAKLTEDLRNNREPN